MNEKTKNESISLQNARKIMVEALQLVIKDSKKYYPKRASDVLENVVNEVDSHFIELSELLGKFSFVWIDSRKSGPDAISPSSNLEDRIDIKVLQTGILDFEQLKRIMIREHTADDARSAFDRISFYRSYFMNLCHEKKLQKQVDDVKLFFKIVLFPAIAHVNWDSERLTKQVQRCNLYYQSQHTKESSRLQKSQSRLTKSSIGIAILAVIISLVIGGLSYNLSNLDYQRTHPDGVYYIHTYFLGYDVKNKHRSLPYHIQLPRCRGKQISEDFYWNCWS